MKNCKNSVKITLVMIYIAMFLIIAFMVALPFIATWYVELKQRPAELATVSMLSCYPCAPFALFALISFKSFIKNVLSDKIFDEKNKVYLKRIIVSCLIIGAIMFLSGFFYKPFFCFSICSFFGALVIKSFLDVLMSSLEKGKKDN